MSIPLHFFVSDPVFVPLYSEGRAETTLRKKIILKYCTMYMFLGTRYILNPWGFHPCNICTLSFVIYWHYSNTCSCCSLCQIGCMHSQHWIISTCSICGTGASTTWPSEQVNFSSAPTLNSACLRFVRCGRRRVSWRRWRKMMFATTGNALVVSSF